MRRALDLAKEMRGLVWPNPPVGCVIVKDGVAVAQAATHIGGRPHAERQALDQAGAVANGATLYVTLEPCCHWGETPPCADAIVDAGVSRVVCAIRDPDPRVNGRGFEKLRNAGVTVTVGAGADEAEQLMSGFFNRIRRGVPEVIVIDTEPAEVPDDVDAVIISAQRGPRLLTRLGQIDLSGVAPHRLLSRMGELGLTSIAVSHRDRLSVTLSSSSSMKYGEANMAFASTTAPSRAALDSETDLSPGRS